jgi:RNA polymerase sigma-70 factor, ECF subfamily
MQRLRGRAVSQLYSQCGPTIYRRCLKLLKDPREARDATQEVFVKLVRDMVRLHDRATILLRIYQLATDHCLALRATSSARELRV